MAILKDELFKLALRNREIKIIPTHVKEYNYNKKCIEIIVNMAGPHLVAEWRKEFKEKNASQN